MTDPVAKAVAEAAVNLRNSARSHKRSANAHRRQARECMAAFSDLERICKQYGITLTIDDGGGFHHGRTNPS